MPRLSNLRPSRDPEFYDLFEAFAAIAVRAAELLDELLLRFPERRTELFEQITGCEREGDETLHRIRELLSRSSGAPFEREDVMALASAMDDIIDLTEEAADYLGLYGIEAPMEQSQKLARILLDSTRQVEIAVRSIRDQSDASQTIHEIHRLENDGDRASRDAIAGLFRGGIDPMVVIRWKDIYQRLEQGIDACEHVADVLDEIIVKSR